MSMTKYSAFFAFLNKKKKKSYAAVHLAQNTLKPPAIALLQKTFILHHCIYI